MPTPARAVGPSRGAATTRRRSVAAATLAASVLTAGGALASSGASKAVPAATGHAAARAVAATGRSGAFGSGRVLHSLSVPTQRQCHRYFFASCYLPQQFASAYDVKRLWADGTTGAGQTIAIIDSYGSPTLRADVKHFDQAFGLPAAHLVIEHPAGPVPAFEPNRVDAVDWATETTLDVDYAHAMAPGATILLLETPVDETEGSHGLRQMMHAARWAVRHGHADVISQSYGATEQTFGGYAPIRRLRTALTLAEQHRVTVLAASGDNGATDFTRSMNSTYRHRVQSWPSADPLVTSVGGLHLDLDSAGRRRSPDRVWHDDYGAGGGGTSIYFRRPGWQRSVRAVVGNHRGVPDVSMTADVDGGALIWTSFKGQPSGWQLIGGTSLATPMFAGVVALADQEAGHRLGLINPALYRLADGSAAARRANGLVDVTRGNNNYAGVRGFAARPGFDLASGWGTIDAYRFVPALVAAAAR